MAEKPGFFDYITAAFNARPFGMFVAPNWIGLGAFGLLGMMEPGFWVLGAGLELGYLLTLATNERFQRLVAAVPLGEATRRLEQAHPGAPRTPRCRRPPHLRSPRAALPLDHRSAAARRQRGSSRRARSAGRQPGPAVLDVPAPAGRAAHDPAGDRRIGRRRRPAEAGVGDRTPAGRRVARPTSCGAASPGSSRSSSSGCVQRTDAERKLAYIDAELERIEQQVELIREQAALSTDPELLSQRIDEITATLGTTGQWIRDQQKVYGAMEDLLTEPPPLAPDARARESQ